ncbi:hypothetical protein [Flavobacterium sp.]|uniref:hypothetical protein n=1 Tax=Flavobacterium sp. TaxID=239 RepID=UPI0028BE3649|nr:hypothetical protein [Flavobacterium sp.]
MGRIFLGLLTVLLLLNFGYKAVLYFSSEKAEGTVVGFEYFSREVETKDKSGNDAVYFIQYEAPIVRFKLESETVSVTTEAWSNEYASLEKGDKVTVFWNTGRENFKLNSFFLFWISVWDAFYGILLLIFGSIVLGIVLPEREPKIRTWK